MMINVQFCYWKVEEGTSEDFGVTVGKLGSETEPGTEDITFIMPQGAVKLTAQWSTTPDDTGTVDSGSDAGGAIAAVAVGSAAVWGGYEVVDPGDPAQPAARGRSHPGQPRPAGIAGVEQCRPVPNPLHSPCVCGCGRR